MHCVVSRRLSCHRLQPVDIILYLITDWGLPHGVARATHTWSYQIAGVKRDRLVANRAFVTRNAMPSASEGAFEVLASVPNLLTFIACHLAQVGGETLVSQNITDLPTTLFCLCRVPHLLTERGIEPPASSETGTGAPPDARTRLHVPICWFARRDMRARHDDSEEP